MRIALTGNPNSGKTTLFNALTGSNQFVGNWPGVTVEKKEGKLKKADGVTVVDKTGMTFKIAADNVILCTGYRSAPIAEKAKHIHIVGDANKVGNLRSVIWGAWDVAMKI